MSSAIVGTISPSQNTGITNMKKEVEQKNDKIIESFSSELKENTDICKDLMKEISTKNGHDQADTAVKREDDVCLKSDVSKNNEQLEKNVKGDESLGSQKQQLTGNIGLSADENRKTEVQILSLSVLSPGRADVVLPIPFPSTTSKETLFTLKEGSKYRIKFHFTVTNNVVKNLTYTYMVWKAGIRVHQTKKLIGTFNPRQEQYTFELEEGTTPTGFFARGPFLVRSKFVDDDGNCYLDTTYYFDIRKDWGAREKC
ncbi:Rho GDP-dissociation inhibitor 1 [Bienertia sinuspersici]